MRLTKLHAVLEQTIAKPTPPINERIRSYKTPYNIQIYNKETGEWYNLYRRVNYDKAVALYISKYLENKKKQPNWRLRPVIRLYDNLYNVVILEHKDMVNAGYVGSWNSPVELAAKLMAEKRRTR